MFKACQRDRAYQSRLFFSFCSKDSCGVCTNVSGGRGLKQGTSKTVKDRKQYNLLPHLSQEYNPEAVLQIQLRVLHCTGGPLNYSRDL